MEKIDQGLTQNEMALERTELSMERTNLANSQTLLAYIRTAIGLLAAGAGMFQFVDNQMIIALGVTIMFLSPIIFSIGIIHYCIVRRRLKKGGYYV